MTSRSNRHSKRARAVMAWGGFCENVLHTWRRDGERGIAVFRTRAEARTRYQDVRRVEIREVERKPK